MTHATKSGRLKGMCATLNKSVTLYLPSTVMRLCAIMPLEKSRIMEAGGSGISAGTEVADVPGAAYRQTHYKGR